MFNRTGCKRETDWDGGGRSERAIGADDWRFAPPEASWAHLHVQRSLSLSLVLNWLPVWVRLLVLPAVPLNPSAWRLERVEENRKTKKTFANSAVRLEYSTTSQCWTACWEVKVTPSCTISGVFITKALIGRHSRSQKFKRTHWNVLFKKVTIIDHEKILFSPQCDQIWQISSIRLKWKQMWNHLELWPEIYV